MAAEANVRVAVAVRPLSENEQENGDECVVWTQNDEIRVLNPDSGHEKLFKFDYTFCNLPTELAEPQEKILEDVGKFLLSSCFNGYNTCVFSYGACGSGKSFIMYGSDKVQGLTPWICQSLFKRASDYKDDTSFRAEVSFLEIHKEFVKDLLGRRRNWQDSLRVREHRELGVYVDKLTKHIVSDVSEALGLIDKGKKNRSICSRSSNSFASGSHTIFTLRFTQARLEDGLPCEMVSVIQLVDLAGSKSIHDECTDNCSTAADVDKSLMTLERVMSSLACPDSESSNSATVPYKDSALTWILKDCFGGNCQTVMVAAVSPAASSHNETLNTLRFANQAKNIMNVPKVNEDANVKLIKELQFEIQTLKTRLKSGNVPSSLGVDKAEKKLQENEDLMKRLTGIWEDKWSKTQKLIEERALAVTELGSALKFETDEPHFVSLGGGRLSIGVTLCPIKRGKTVIGVATETCKPDIQLRGKGIEPEHCTVEYNGDAVVLYPKANLCSVDGIPISEPTRLPQGCMICLGKSNYFRFNHPREAKRIKESNPGNRFSIVPDQYYPDVELAIEQYKRDKKERDRLEKENERLLSLENEYKEAVERIEFEKSQLEEERQKLQEMEQQHKEAVESFEDEIAVQIKELERQREELQHFEEEKEKLAMLQEKYEENVKKQELERANKEKKRQQEYERLKTMKAKLEGEEGTEKERVAIEELRQQLALQELNSLEEELQTYERQQLDSELIEEERKKLDEMKERQSVVIKQLEEELNAQIKMLKEEREKENNKIEQEKQRIQLLEKQQQEVLKQIELERQRLDQEREEERRRLQQERERLDKLEEERMELLENAAREQEQEKQMIESEKKRLVELEEKHAQAMKEIEDAMISKQDKMERERQIEFEFFETEQLLLEELEQKQREAAEQLDREREIIRQQFEKEREEERKQVEGEQRRLQELQIQQQETLRQAEEERRRLQAELKSQRELMQKEKSRLVNLEKEYKKIRCNGSEAPLVLSALNMRDISQLGKGCSLEERKQRLEEEKRRLIELKKEAENLHAKQQESGDSGSSGDERAKNQTAKKLQREKERRVQLEKQLAELQQKNNNTAVADDGQKVKELEQALGMERSRRQEMERILSEKQKQEELERVAAAERARKEMMTEKAIQERLPAKVKNGTSHHDNNDLNLVQYLVSTGHVLENCPSVRVTAHACKGYLSKLGGKIIKSWKKRWFVLDRQKRALCYYSDEHQRVPKGIVYFQAIQDVYVDLPSSHKSSSTRTTFCVKTPQETYCVAAPSGLAMSIWIDAILTGREGADFYN
ncbi:kinesin-like protein KIF16B isoform X1 [Pocillopora verrucosa]|uniref:kinesin-like protein KIF16B isoform X1 n=2 Tax=Pocillopora verrucosa TaxID=203993 RepID=UPI00334171A4